MEGAQVTVTDLAVGYLELPNVALVIGSPGGAVDRRSLGLTPIVIGTDPDGDVVVSDPRVSRQHAEIVRSPDGRVLVRDLDSKNGTFVDSVRIAKAYLDARNRVAIGGTVVWLERNPGAARVPLAQSVRFGEALGASLPMRMLFANLERAAASEETIVLHGESGTGKEVLARAIHAASPRRDAAFVVFDCSTVAATLAESELFGHTRGAFTGALQAHAGVFERAHGGTLFVDELGELPIDLQPKLLRALEARQIRRIGSTEWVTVDVRVLAATHRDLRARIAEGAFREDLYYRLAVLEVRVPPLRERLDDLPMLVDHFLASQRPPRSRSELPANVEELMRAYDWPGNIRELRNTVARMLHFPEQVGLPVGPAGAVLTVAPSSSRPSEPTSFVSPLRRLIGLTLRAARDVVVEEFERAYIAAKLGEHSGNVSRTAEAMGVSRQFLHRLLERYRIARQS